MKKLLCIEILIGLTIFFSACKKTEVPLVPPQILSFIADPTEILNNQSSTLSWNVFGADLVEISNIGTVANSGTQTVNPTSTTTYTLTATNNDGSNSREVTITVSASVVGKWYVLYKYNIQNGSGYFHITFYPDGHFFSSGTGGNLEGTWSQTKDNIIWTYPNLNCTYKGTVSVNTMQGTMVNFNYSGNWSGTRQ